MFNEQFYPQDITVSRATTATRVDENGLIVTSSIGIARIDYSTGEAALLVEPQGTNLLTWSEQFNNATWVKVGATISANATTSPDGTQNADKLIANTTNVRHFIYKSITTPNTHTFTTYAKAGENSFLMMRLDNDTTEVKNWFNLSNGTVGTSQGGSPTITSVGNGWYRCSMQYTPSTLSTIYAVLYTAKTDGVQAFAGNDSDGTYIWGAQLEAGAYATSYIPTTSTSVTRNADVTSKTGVSSLIGQTEGTIFVDFDNLLQTSYANEYLFSLFGNSSNQVWIRKESGTNTYSARVLASGSTAVTIVSIPVLNGRNKIALAYKSGQTALYLNGSLFATDADVYTFNGELTRMDLASLNGSLNGFTKIYATSLNPTPLSDTDCIELTTL
jgi:hypothetical protein